MSEMLLQVGENFMKTDYAPLQENKIQIMLRQIDCNERNQRKCLIHISSDPHKTAGSTNQASYCLFLSN